MTTTIFQLLGGIGLFLLGMGLLTDGLKALAGRALQRALARFTGTPAAAFASGALVTLMVQSSSATTVALIGFVSAGLIAFPQAVGVVMGASMGTTGTGWLVSVLGLKVSLGLYALPLVGVGALLRLLSDARGRAIGLALAGFGLIFVGIDTLQAGMRALGEAFDLARLPAIGLLGHLAAMAVGALMTVVMQSSSAAVATTLTALHAQAIDFEQAAALVIGAAIGTTVTGVLAAIGGSVPAKRTALTHVLFNLATGLIAILLLPLLLHALALAQEHLALEPGAVSLAAFHTLFIGLGVVLFLPFAEPLARAIERLLPDRGPRLTRHLDDSLLEAPPVALEATRRALVDIALAIVELLEAPLRHDAAGVDRARRAEVAAGLERTGSFFARIPPLSADEPLSAPRVALLHALDHLGRLRSRLGKVPDRRAVWGAAALRPAVERCGQVLALARAALLGDGLADGAAKIERHALALTELRRQRRAEILSRTALGAIGAEEATQALDAVRWLERVAHHAWRAAHYLTLEEPDRLHLGAEAAELAEE